MPCEIFVCAQVRLQCLDTVMLISDRNLLVLVLDILKILLLGGLVRQLSCVLKQIIYQ